MSWIRTTLVVCSGGAGVQGDGGQAAAAEHAPGEPRHPRGGTPAPATGRVANKKPNPINPKNPLKMFFFLWNFLGFLKFIIFYENNTNFSL
jgi:hypothetical protein